MAILDWFRGQPGMQVVEVSLQHLEALGYLKFTASPNRDQVRRNLLNSLKQGYVDSDWDEDCVSLDHRTYPADSEELAEGQIAPCLLLMKPVLEHEGVRFNSVQEHFSEDIHELVVDGERFLIANETHSRSVWYWANAAKRLCEIVNELLQRANSSERLFGVYGGNEGQVMFLTPQLHAYISSLPFIDKKWLPYRLEEIDLSEYE